MKRRTSDIARPLWSEHAANIAIEAEMGRIEDGENRMPTVDMDAVLAQPDGFLAPSIGNIHKWNP